MSEQQSTTMLKRVGLLGVIIASLMAPGYVLAEDADPANEQAEPHVFSESELHALVGPIALYVDDLVAVVLTASVYPLQIVEAERFLSARKDDPALEPDPDWDEAVVALLNYPDVLKMMSERLQWTADLGEAFAYQQEDVMDAIQDFRRQAWSAGNLHSDDRTMVREDTGQIELVPVEREVIYVPYYEPARVIVYSEAPVIRYYPTRYPLYYYPYTAGYVFDNGFFFGVTTAFMIGWHSHNVHVYYHDYKRHPYYGRRYTSRYYVRHPARVSGRYDRYADHIWRPSPQWHTRSRIWSRHNHRTTDHRARERTRDSQVYTKPSPAREHGVGRDRRDIRPLDAGSFSNHRRSPQNDSRPAAVRREQASTGNVPHGRPGTGASNRNPGRADRRDGPNGVARGPVSSTPGNGPRREPRAERNEPPVAAVDEVVEVEKPAPRRKAADKDKKRRRMRDEPTERR